MGEVTLFQLENDLKGMENLKVEFKKLREKLQKQIYAIGQVN